MLRNAIAALALFLASPVNGQDFGTPAEGEILSGWREQNGTHVAGLMIRLAPGWKTYWRAPGANGIPPRFNWSGSQNLAGVEVRYPVPKVLVQNGLRSIGYENDVVFPLIVSARDASQPIRLAGEIEIGVCEDVCVPMTLRLRAELPVAGGPSDAISKGLKDQPDQGGELFCQIEPIADGLRLRAAVRMPRMRDASVVVETGETGVWVSEPILSRTGNRLVAEVEMVPPEAQPFALARNEVRMTVIAGGRAIEMLGCS